MYCSTFQTKMARHLINKHKDVPDVTKYMKIQGTDAAKQRGLRRELCKILINKSNKVYNDEVINNTKLGTPIPMKTSKKFTESSHVVCSICGGLISKRYFSSHSHTCKRRQITFENVTETKKPVASLLRPKLSYKYKALEQKIFPRMNKDSISLIAQSDPLILEFGRRFLNSHMAINQKNYVSNKMRSLADLLIRFKNTDPVNIKSMADCVDPTNFDGLCNIIKHWSVYNEDSGMCAVGSVPRRLCKSLKMCSYILWSESIKNKLISHESQIKEKEKHDRFMTLMYTDWSIEINSISDKSLKFHKIAKEDKMPLVEDIRIFFKEATRRIKDAVKSLNEIHGAEQYNTLIKLCIPFLITFNGRRPSEVVYSKIENFSTLQTRPDPENKDTSLAVFNVAALKNNIKVPIITPGFVQQAIEDLLEHRLILNVKGNLLLGKLDGTAYNGSNLIAKLKSGLNLQKPEFLTANGMRHYWATISQKDPEIKRYMPKCLGHTNSTHQKFYENSMSDIHLNIVGPVLFRHCLSRPDNVTECSNIEPMPGTSRQAIENDLYYAKELSNMNDSDMDSTIGIEPLSNCETNSNSNCIENGPIPSINQSSMIEDLEVSPPVNSNKHILDMTADDQTSKPQQNGCTSDDPNFEPLQNSSNDSSDDSNFDVDNNCRTPKRISNLNINESSTEKSPIFIGKRNNWLTPEREELFNGLPKTVLGLEHAGRGKIKHVWENSTLLKRRHSLQTTRIEVSKYFTKKKTISTPIRK